MDLVVESLKSEKIRKEFINQFIEDADIASQTLTELAYKYLCDIKSTRELVLKCISGIKKSDLSNGKRRTLADCRF